MSEKKQTSILIAFAIFFLVWLFITNRVYAVRLSLLFVLGILGILGAVVVDLIFPKANRFIKYFINALWVSLFIALYSGYTIFSNDNFFTLSLNDKITWSGVVSLLSILAVLPVQYFFFNMSSAIFAWFQSRK
jgi:hypothetical protein